MSWHCSQALVAAFSAANCSAGAPSAPSNTTPMPAAFYWPDKTTEHSRLSRFGMTSEPLTEERGEELLTWYRADFHARTSAFQVRATDLTVSEVGCGPKWQGSFAKYNPDSCSWKTHQLSLVEGLDEFSETWPKWGSMRNGECWELTTPGLRTCATDYGLWPTPCASDSSDRKASPRPHLTKNGTIKHIGKSGVMSQIRLSQAVKHFAAPEDTDGPLNPSWTEWLMGWPIGQTDLKPLETAKFQEWLQQHGEFSPMSETA